MRSERTTYRTLRRRLLARASALAMRVALRPRGWAPGLLAAGLIGAQAPALAQETIDLATDAELTIQGAAADDRSGVSVSGAGDVNGDGIDDLIIGAHRADPNGRTMPAPATWCSAPITAFRRPSTSRADGRRDHPGRRGYDRSGLSVSGAGDVNGDGIDDLIIGAPGADPNGRDYAGASYVVFGAIRASPATIDLADADGADLIIQGAAAYDHSGAR